MEKKMEAPVSPDFADCPDLLVEWSLSELFHFHHRRPSRVPLIDSIRRKNDRLDCFDLLHSTDQLVLGVDAPRVSPTISRLAAAYPDLISDHVPAGSGKLSLRRSVVTTMESLLCAMTQSFSPRIPHRGVL